MTSRPWAPGPLVTRRRLGGELRRMREASGLKLDDVAKRLECSPSKISRLENGKGIPKSRDVRDILDVLGVGDAAERERLMEWSRTGQRPTWWSAYADVLPSGMDRSIEWEWDAARLIAYETHLVHGLLQTRDYARAVLGTAFGEMMSAADIERLVEVRMWRQEALTLDHGLSFQCLLDESTLYRVVGSVDIQRAQIEHLISIARAQHVDVRVLPLSAGIVRDSRESFAKLEFTALEQGVIYVERPRAAAEFFHDPPEVDEYARRLAGLQAVALSERESIPLMERALSSAVGARPPG